jgi:hypothetical protein
MPHSYQEKKASRELKQRTLDRLTGKALVPTQHEFLEELIRLAGGPRALAALIYKEMSSERCPPTLKARVLDTVLRAMKAVEDVTGPPEVSDLTDDELVQLIADRVGKLDAG